MAELPLIPTTLVGSYPQPDWLIDRERLMSSLPARVRMKELWRVPEPYLAEAQDDATALAIRDLERVGRPTVWVKVPLEDGARVAALYRDGEVLSRNQTDTDYEFLVRLEVWQVNRLREEGIAVASVDEAQARRKVSGE